MNPGCQNTGQRDKYGVLLCKECFAKNKYPEPELKRGKQNERRKK